MAIIGIAAFFLVGGVAEYISTQYSRSVVRDDCFRTVISSMLIEGWRYGGPLVTMFFPGNDWCKVAFVVSYILGVGVGAYLAMNGIQNVVENAVQRTKELA
jgi:hypothetical protein